MKRLLLYLIVLIPLLSFKTKEDNVAIVSSYFELLFKKGDLPALEKIISPTAVYSQAAGLPYGGTYTGLKEWIAMFTKVQSYFDVSIIDEPLYYSNPENNIVIATFNVKFKSKKTGKEINMPITECFELQNGLIIKITPFYFDTQLIRDFAGKQN